MLKEIIRVVEIKSSLPLWTGLVIMSIVCFFLGNQKWDVIIPYEIIGQYSAKDDEKLLKIMADKSEKMKKDNITIVGQVRFGGTKNGKHTETGKIIVRAPIQKVFKHSTNVQVGYLFGNN